MSRVFLHTRTRFHSISYHADFIPICISSHAMQCNAMLCYTMQCYAILCYAMQCYAMLHYTMQCHAMHAMLCMLCYVMVLIIPCSSLPTPLNSNLSYSTLSSPPLCFTPHNSTCSTGLHCNGLFSWVTDKHFSTHQEKDLKTENYVTDRREVFYGLCTNSGYNSRED